MAASGDRVPQRGPLRVALLGCGTVGSEVFRLLREQASDLAARVGAPLQVAGVAVRDPDGRALTAGVGRDLVTTDAMALVTRPDVDIVVEMIGGIEPARELLLAAMRTGKSVVTANKALLGADSAVMHAAAREHGADLFYEAAVAGAIPLLRPLRESILASLAFHTRVSAADVYRQGITALTAADIEGARVLGCVVKLLAICERTGDGISVRVHPAMISREHPLASVRGAYNAVFVEAESAGRLMFYGAGAGGGPTASAMLGDLVVVARNRVAGIRGPDAPSYAELPVLPMSEAMTRYHVALDVADRPGVLAPVAEAFARHDVSIQAVRQEGHGDDAHLVIVTHTARESALAATVADLSAMEAVRAVDSVLRVEGEDT